MFVGGGGGGGGGERRGSKCTCIIPSVFSKANDRDECASYEMYMIHMLAESKDIHSGERGKKQVMNERIESLPCVCVCFHVNRSRLNHTQ